MCGIHLVTGIDYDKPIDVINKMVEATAYRGPDSSGTFADGKVAMGFNRLAIIGGQQGEQPITVSSAGLTLIGNGEIFNYRELDEDFVYETTSDLEIILHLYERYGPTFLERLEGQFSFVLYDAHQNQIMLARDRWGITPLFYSTTGGLALSSSIKALVRATSSDLELDPLGIAEQWCLYGPTPPRTIFKDIFQLPPGGVATYDLTTASLTIRQYIEQSLAQTTQQQASSASLKDALTRSVHRRLPGEHGPGVYVSGGVDSSLIAALVAQSTKERPTLFSIAFADPAYDESLYQKQLAAHLGYELKSVIVDIPDIIENLDECLSFTESPLIRSAPVPMMLLSRLVNNSGIKYVLCGEGADELFAGYPVFQKQLSSVVDKQAEAMSFASYFQSPEALGEVSTELGVFTDSSSLNDLRQDEINTKLSRYLLTNQGDRVAMANSIEQRFPFLDTEVAQLAAMLPEEYLIRDGEGKYLLREAFKDLLPHDLLYRKKQGYLTPDIEVATALQKMNKTKELLSEATCKKYGVFDYQAAQDLFDPIDTNAKARFLIFVYSTHRLMELVTKD